MRSVNQPVDQLSKSQEEPRGIRERFWDLFRGNKEESNEKPPLERLFDLMSQSEEYVPQLKEVLAEHPQMNEALDKLLSEELTLEDATGLAMDLSDEFGPSLEERHGRRYATSFSLPSGYKLTIRLFRDTNGTNDRMLFSIGGGPRSLGTSV